jgi:hypothetical protein
MPMTYEIDSASGIVRVTMTGHLTAGDFHDYMRATREDPAFRPEMSRLVIALSVESFPSGPEIQAIAQETRARSLAPGARFAVVANTPLAVGMANMLFIQSGLDERYAIFRDEAAAKAWLVS